MQKWLTRLILFALLFLAGRWIISTYVSWADDQYRAREDLSRHLAEEQAKQMGGAVEAAQMQRAEQMGRMLEEFQQGRDYDSLLDANR